MNNKTLGYRKKFLSGKPNKLFNIAFIKYPHKINKGNIADQTKINLLLSMKTHRPNNFTYTNRLS